MTQDETEAFVLAEFDVLRVEHGYAQPRIIRKSYNCDLYYQKNLFCFQVELDWREHRAFLLLVRLQDGKLPDGYYLAGDGRPCRLHLRTVAAERGWIENPQPAKKKPGRSAMPDAIATDLRSEKLTLLACLDKIERDWDLFWL